MIKYVKKFVKLEEVDVDGNKVIYETVDIKELCRHKQFLKAIEFDYSKIDKLLSYLDNLESRISALKDGERISNEYFVIYRNGDDIFMDMKRDYANYPLMKMIKIKKVSDGK